MPVRKPKTEPQILEMPPHKMAVVSAKGAPEKVFPGVFPALYGSVYTLKFEFKKKGLPSFKVSAPRARYPDALDVPMDKWTIILGMPVPEDITTLPQKVAGVEVKLETWDYGTVAQILHLGAYDQEQPTVERLHKFIADSGYDIAGVHEEEYLSRPNVKIPKTIIRYQIKKRRG